MVNHVGRLISRLSMCTLPARHTTRHHPSFRPVPFLTGRKRQYSTHGTDTIAYPYAQRTDTSPPSSLHGADTATRQPLRGTLPLVMDTPGDMMRLSRGSRTRQNVLTTSSCRADTLEGSFFHAVEWLDICGRNGITLNPRKFTFGADVVEFAGFEITPDSVRPCEKHLKAILDFPTPTNVTDVRSWFGLVNQVSYAFSMTEKMLPFRELLKPSVPFVWTDALQRAFDKSKAVIASEIEEGVRIFDPSKPTCLATDWSKNGIGFWLLQKTLWLQK